MVVIVFIVGAAVKPAANSLPEDTKEPEPTQPTTEAVQQEPYPFNLMSLDWSGEELEVRHRSRSADSLQLRRDGCISARMEQRTDRHRVFKRSAAGERKN